MQSQWFEGDVIFVFAAAFRLVLFRKVFDDHGLEGDGHAVYFLLELDDGLVNHAAGGVLNYEFGTLVHLELHTFNNFILFSESLLPQLFLLLLTPKKYQTLLYEIRIPCYPVLLLDHFIEPNGKQVHQNPSVQYQNDGPELWIDMVQVFVARTV